MLESAVRKRVLHCFATGSCLVLSPCFNSFSCSFSNLDRMILFLLLSVPHSWAPRKPLRETQYWIPYIYNKHKLLMFPFIQCTRVWQITSTTASRMDEFLSMVRVDTVGQIASFFSGFFFVFVGWRDLVENSKAISTRQCHFQQWNRVMWLLLKLSKQGGEAEQVDLLPHSAKQLHQESSKTGFCEWQCWFLGAGPCLRAHIHIHRAEAALN